MSVATERFVFPVDIESSLSEAEGRALADLAEGKVALELGAWQGRSTVCIAQTAKQLVSVDWHQGDPHAGEGSTLGSYWSSLGRYGLQGRVITIIGRFEDVLPVLGAETFEFVFLDGFHTYEQVKVDVELVRPHLAADATLALHDYGVDASSHGGGAFGVTQAAQEVLGAPESIVDTLAVFGNQ